MVGQTLETLLPVITGGIIGLLGGVVAPFVSHRLTTNSDRRRERIEKFEELFSLLGSHDSWLEDQRNHIVFGHTINSYTPPLVRAQAICAIHFHALSSVLSELDLATKEYQHWMAQAGVRRLEGKMTTVNQGFEAVFQQYLSKRSEVLDALSHYAKRKDAFL
ncbi:hypothetical protein ACLBWS_10820 [Brucellaceae bacterium D45D]